MSKLKVYLENCFGIHKLEHEFLFENNNSVLIYAPNGVMKSSFAKTFDCIAKNDKTNTPSDIVYPERISKYEIKFDDKDILPESIFVVDTDTDIDSNKKITTLLASKELKNEYDSIYQILEDAKKNYVKLVKEKSSSSDCENELIETFKNTEQDDLFTCLLTVENDLKNEYRLYDFKYNDVFDKKGNVEKFVEKNKALLQDYFDKYNILLRQSNFFKSNNNGISFGTYQANQILNSVADDAFFSASHKIQLSNGINICTKQELEELIQNEITKIFENEKLKKSFEAIDKAIGNNIELRLFKSVLEKNNSIIIELNDYRSFRKKVWLGYLHSLSKETEQLLNLYKSKKTDLTEILKKASKENSKWKEIIDIYNKRFFVPFQIKIQNQEDVILKENAATLSFLYKDSEGDEREQKKESLLKVLSRGERRAFFILQFIFEIEARRAEKRDTILILDDIADSFDYKNKYAIIEYIKDISNFGIFKQIILTHNFDFYRTVSSRLCLGKSVYMAIKNNNRIVELKYGGYRKDFFGGVVVNNAENNPKDFIAMIPFVRNIIEYTKGQDCEEYKDLTACLHVKEKSLTKKEVADIFANTIDRCKNIQIDKNTSKIIDFIKETAKSISEETNLDEILLENKLVLSIAIRLISEEFMIAQLKDKIDIAEISRNQTKELIDKYKIEYPSNNNLKVLEEVNMMTPENIHVNSFMYEPLIDMSVKHLIELYKNVLQLS